MKKICKNKNKQKIISIIIIGMMISSTPLALLILNVNYTNSGTNYNKNSLKSQGIIQDQYTVQWLDNPTFESPIDPWYNTTEGDESDINASIDVNQVNYEILGNSGIMHIDEALSSSDWSVFKNPEFPVLPDTYGIDDRGCYVSHTWDEGVNQTRNVPSVHWKRNIEMPVNMSDYIITEAKLEVIFNATVTTEVGGANPQIGGVDRKGDAGLDAYAVGDYAEFYILISDIDNSQEYQIGYNQTVPLGQDSPAIPTITDKLMDVYTENVLIDLLTAVLESDYFNFTIALGINIYCEDNEYGADEDIFDELVIKSFNLTFSYEKEIDKFTAISWNQVGNTLPSTDIDIINATLNFKFKIDQDWPTLISPNSEFRVYINNRLHFESIKLDNASLTYKDIKDGGLDVTSLILKSVNISVAIQVYLADTFSLNQKITLSITNATLEISYVENTIEDTTSLDLFLNTEDKTLEKSIEVKWGTKINVTVVYKDSLSSFIPDALVQLNPFTDPINLTENVGLEHYNITLDTRDMVLGNNYFQLSADKRYYEDILIQFNIKVLERDTEIKLFLDNQDKTLDKSIQMIYGNDGNITITYEDIEDLPAVHIDNALVQLEGMGGTRILNPAGNQYTIIINTAELRVGNSFLTVIAQKDNYTSQSIRFKIEVLERNSYIDQIILNGVEQTNIELQWFENLNIVITYNDTNSDSFISGALVQAMGTGISITFFEDTFNYYYDINTNELKIGVNYLTISAIKENYTLASRIISINVVERATYIDEILLNQKDRTENKTLTITAGEYLNVTFKYKDSSTDNPIAGANASIVSTAYSTEMNENLINHEYTIEFNSSLLGVGAKFLYIYASLENYTISSEVLTIFILERGSILEVTLTSTQNPEPDLDKYIEVEIWETINITVTFRDLITSNHLENASVELLGFGEFNETTEQYTYIVNAGDLDEGIDILNIIAQKSGYLSQAAQVTIEIIKRATKMDLFLNTVNSTADPYLEIPIGSGIDIAISYIDSSDLFVTGASVTLLGEGLDEDMDEDSLNELYYYSLNTRDLDIGVRLLTIIAQRNNYEIQTIDIRIVVQRIRTNITSSTGSNLINTTPGSQITLSVILTNLDFNEPILGALVSFRWEGEPGELTDSNNDGVYEATVPNIPIGSHTFTITANAGDDYDFVRYEIIVTAVQPEGQAELFALLMSVALIAAGALGTYLLLYQTYFQYPKPVRKVRKYRKTLNKERDPNIDVVSQEAAFKQGYRSEYDKSSKYLTGKSSQKSSLETESLPKKQIGEP